MNPEGVRAPTRRFYKVTAQRFQLPARPGRPSFISCAYAVLPQPTDRITSVGHQTYCVALLARRRTDSLLVDIKNWPEVSRRTRDQP
jgi:hypothetical protein